MYKTPYLNDGVGKACAGHNKARLFPMDRSKVNIFDSEEKAGALDPMGSNKKKMKETI